MNKLKFATIGLLMAAGPAFADGHATGDAEAGEKVFKKCKACHSIVDNEGETVVKGGKNAPNLYGVYNRVAGTEEGFAKKYGDSIKEAGEAGLMWNEEDFLAYAEDPKKFLRSYLDDKKAKSKMAFKLKKEDDRKNVWAFIVSKGPEIVAEEEETKSE